LSVPIGGYELFEKFRIPDAIAKVLETHIGAVKVKHQDIHVSNCPLCGTGLSDEKCPTCANCGWSKCNGV